jgi:phenylacetate-coenzyme A ligase PaaK-like adenylate-forming protein
MSRFGRHARQWLMGPAYFHHRALIRASKSWDAAQIADYQKSRMESILARYGAEVRDKAHYRENLERYNRLCLPGLATTIRTGGTTGTPFSFQMDRFVRRQRERAYIFDIWADVDYRPFDNRVVFRGNIGDKLIAYNRLQNAWSISAAHFTEKTRVEVLQFLRGMKPFFLHVYPSSLFGFIELLGDEEFRSLPSLGILAGSEGFPPGQMERFEREFGLPIAHWYGHSEYASLARYCRDCQGFHFYPTYGYTEFVLEAEGEPGTACIVATSFNAVGTQFVRYDTGDRARLSTRECRQPFPRVDGIEGRSQEFFIDREGQRRAFGPYLFGIHNRFWEILSAIQFEQREAGRLIVRAVLKDAAERAWLETFLVERFAVASLDFDYVPAIVKTADGKHRYYINALR